MCTFEKEQLEILEYRLAVEVFFKTRIPTFPVFFGGNWEGKLSSFIEPIMCGSFGCHMFMLSSL